MLPDNDSACSMLPPFLFRRMHLVLESSASLMEGQKKLAEARQVTSRSARERARRVHANLPVASQAKVLTVDPMADQAVGIVRVVDRVVPLAA